MEMNPFVRSHPHPLHAAVTRGMKPADTGAYDGAGGLGVGGMGMVRSRGEH